uniref:Uncharacterized protein n=1 Tax=viral metagenome TaxID=1070528 RepID=A0A6C0F7R3_9ZZZZ|tara:strand:- start:3403 stop:4032 length:630 start_codon:yes stop_codon:yes gene_type:complete
MSQCNSNALAELLKKHNIKANGYGLNRKISLGQRITRKEYIEEYERAKSFIDNKLKNKSGNNNRQKILNQYTKKPPCIRKLRNNQKSTAKMLHNMRKENLQNPLHCPKPLTIHQHSLANLVVPEFQQANWLVNWKKMGYITAKNRKQQQQAEPRIKQEKRKRSNNNILEKLSAVTLSPSKRQRKPLRVAKRKERENAVNKLANFLLKRL